ncbi:aromatic amino acid lyase [Acinetobacter baumannii]|nr:aromatic amino acid lyase [Acinetobacter baumannii]
MELVIDKVEDFNLENYRKIAWEGQYIKLSDDLKKNIKNQRDDFMCFLDKNSEKPFYGITTAHHTGSKKLLTDEQKEEYLKRLPPTPPAIMDTIFPDRVVRGIIFTRLIDFIRGTSPTTLETTERVCNLLKFELPKIPVLGLGEPGDIIPLGILFSELSKKYSLSQGEGMFLINGSPVATALLADTILSAKNQINRIESIIALAASSIKFNIEQYDPSLNFWQDQYQIESLENLRFHLDGEQNLDQTQAPVCFRSAPRLLGWHRRVINQAIESVNISISSPSNNPAFVKNDNGHKIISNGGYHNAAAAGNIDAIIRSTTDLTILVNHMINRLTEYNDGISKYESIPILSVLYLTSAGWTDQARNQCTPSLISSSPGGQTDTSTSEALAWQKYIKVQEALDINLTILGILASNTINFQGEEAPSNLKSVFNLFLREMPIPIDYSDYSNIFNRVKSEFLLSFEKKY